MHAFLLSVLLSLTPSVATERAVTPLPSGPATPAAALVELLNGNLRFQKNARTRTIATSSDAKLRASLVAGQAPFAVVVGCSDSRCMEAFLFDQELGRIFTVREAGNLADENGLGSIEYAVEHLGSKVIIVLGHHSCGAIKAVYEAAGNPLPGHLGGIQAAIEEVIEDNPKKATETKDAYLRRLEKANAIAQAAHIANHSHEVSNLMAQGKVKVVAGHYDLSTGKVSILGEIVAGSVKAPAVGCCDNH